MSDAAPMSRAEHLATIQAELLTGVPPSVARAHLVVLTAMWGDYASAATEAEIAYAKVAYQMAGDDEPANKLERRAKATAEYARMRRTKTDAAFVLELIRSCKSAMKSQDEEMRMTPR